MGTGDRHLLSSLRLHSHGGGGSKKDQQKLQQLSSTPKGCLAVMVGLDGEQKQRFVVPIEYLGHPLFQRLLKKVEEKYGFHHKGAIAVPCRSSDFLSVQSEIDRDSFIASLRRERGSNFHANLVACFRA